MRPRERRDGGQKDLFRARRDQIVNMNHPLAKLAATIDCGLLEKRCTPIVRTIPPADEADGRHRDP
jgi:hypothetical protein